MENLLSLNVVDRREDRLLAVCAGEFDELLMTEIGWRSFSLSNISTDLGVYRGAVQGQARESGWTNADAHDLPFAAGSFEVSFVSDGLHHCRSPHAAVAEMVRVSSRAVIAIETRDSLLMRLLRKTGASQDFELNARLIKSRMHGGLDFGAVPNFVYRWTEREFIRTVLSADPAHEFSFFFFHGVKMPPRFGAYSKAAGRLVRAVAPRQGNLFGMVAERGGLRPWMENPQTLKNSVTRPSDVRPRKLVNERHFVPKFESKWDGFSQRL